MKNLIKITLFFFALVMTIGCEEEYVAPDNEMLDATWYTSIAPGVDFSVAVDKNISFMDLSQGALSHEWQLTDGDGTYFMNADFYGADTLMDYVDASMGLVTSDLTVHVLFSESGLKTVRLYNEYPEKVIYPGTIPLESKKIGDVWVIDTTFTVDVFGKMLPAFQVFKVLDDGTDSLVLAVSEDEEVDLAETTNLSTISVEAGTQLKYVDMTTSDRPTGRTWTINRGNGNETFLDSVATISYLKLGTSTGSSLKTERVESGNLPAASAIKRIPLVVTVIPSSKPFTFLGELVEAKDETISFRVSGEVASITNGESAFTVYVKNTSGFDRAIDVISAKISSSDASIIELSLLESIYNSDDITVAFDNTVGTITSTDARDLEAFSGEVVSMNAGESSVDPAYCGFENISTNIKAGYSEGWWFGNGNDDGAGAPMFERVTSMNYSGTASMKYQYTDGVADGDKKIQGSWFPGVKNDVLPAGNYNISFMIYLDEGNTLSQIRTTQKLPFTTMEWDLTTTPRGEWVKLEQKVDFSALDISGAFNFVIPTATNATATRKQLMYFDDVSFVKIEDRP